jgi:thiol-disulfide isomerase/thioredoxin
VIKGKMNEYRSGEIVLFKAVDGGRAKCATYGNTKDLDFSFAVPVKEAGLYYLSDQTGWWYVRLYLKPNDQVELNISYPGKYQIVKGSPENKLLWEWFNTVSAVTIPSFNSNDTITFQPFSTKVNELLPAGKKFQKRIVTGNSKFNELMKQITDIDVEYAALRFCFTPRDCWSTHVDFTPFLSQFVVPKKYCNTQLMKLGEWNDLLQLFSTAATFVKHAAGPTAASLKQTCELFCNDTIRGAFLSTKLGSYKYIDKFQEEIVPLESYFITASQKKAYQEKLSELSKALHKGSPAANFNFEDSTGTQVSMESFKGKVVLIDMWATWCQPCRGEIPHLKKLEEEYKDNKNVVFMGISFDESRDKQKWKTFLHENDMAGVQLFASGFKNPVSDYYQVNAIPRFIVIDKAGKIFDVDAPRPSQPQLKTVIDKALEATN